LTDPDSQIRNETGIELKYNLFHRPRILNSTISGGQSRGKQFVGGAGALIAQFRKIDFFAVLGDRYWPAAAIAELPQPILARPIHE
jgi:hypothetical protein